MATTLAHTRIGGLLAAFVVAVLLSVAPPALAQAGGQPNLPPSGAAGSGMPMVPTQQMGVDESQMWSAIRRGVPGHVSIPNEKAAVLIQSEGELWRSVRNGPLATYGAWIMLGIFGVLAAFYLFRGRIRIDGPKTGRTIERFGSLERAAHWLTAGSFIILALTGLNLLYGRHILMPLIGPEAFAALAQYGKFAHNYLGFAFMVGVVLIFLLWVRHNIPNKHDLRWFAVGGGLFSKGVHPPAKKFNAGQKIIFWTTVLGGAALGYTGVQLLFPFYFTTIADLQLYSVIHAGVSVVMIAIIIGHIYIGSVGMEGAFAAMGTGQVEEQWAREHHGLWVAEIKGEPPPRSGHHGGRHGGHHPAPAE